MKNKINHSSFLKRIKAFSLIELSIVIIVIGILVSSVVGGRKLIIISNLSKARALTNSSPVNGIEDLVLWVEAVSKSSFATAQPADGTAVATWYDINPQLTYKNNATQSTGGNQPAYAASAINGLPAVNFDGTSDYLFFDGNVITNSDYTIFLVEYSRNISSQRLIIFGSNAAPGATVNFFYTGGSSVYVNHNLAPDVGYSVAGIKPRIYTIKLAFPTLTLYENGVSKDSNSAVRLTSFNNAKISGVLNGSDYYDGYVGEMIIFARALSDFEQQEIQKYLSKKWGIKLT